MSDFQRSLDGNPDEERLPWLEPVDDYDDEQGLSLVRLIGAVIIGLVALGLVIGGIYWARNRDSADGHGELIVASDEPYKDAPEEAGGMKVEGTGDVAYGASTGNTVASSIDLSAMPEAPVTDQGSVAAPEVVAPAQPKPKPKAETPAPAPKPARTQTAKIETGPPSKAPAAPQAPKPQPVKVASAPVLTADKGGPGIQLGAFSSPASANKAWGQLSQRFAYLSGYEHAVAPVSVGGRTLYRLRVKAGGESGAVCGKLKVAGESCVVVD